MALVGHNGAGKTTLMKLMLGLIRPSAGQIAVLGQNPASGFGARAEIGFLPETIAFSPSLTGRELLRFYARLKRAPRDVDPLLEQVGLADTAHRRVGTYSKGMRQRLGLAQALLGSPRLLLSTSPRRASTRPSASASTAPSRRSVAAAPRCSSPPTRWKS